MSSEISRRGLLGRLLRPLSGSAAAAASTARALANQPGHACAEKFAVIQGKHCIALTDSCSLCVERCPVPGAMRLEDEMPLVVPEICTGCGICYDVCPAPTNAVVFFPRTAKRM